ncbi:MAG: ABC transporter permease [Acidimicrobiaceae bacterium]|nr:ABC transporter permease [Acidimicrobiaceae bacterium]
MPIVPPGRYRLKHVAQSEVWKILTLRSTAIIFGVTVVATLLITGLVANSQLHHDPGYYQGFDATQHALTGLIAAALTGGVFGALLITGEYASGTMRTTLSAVPRRPVLMTAKIGVTAAFTFVFCQVLSFLAFFLGEAILSGGGAPSAGLGSPGALRAVVMTGVFIALLALMSFAFGLIFRSTAAAIAAFVGVVFVLPLVMHGISEAAVAYLPTNILVNSIMSTVPTPPGSPYPPVSAGVGLALMALYTAIPLAAGVVLFNKRDA